MGCSRLEVSHPALSKPKQPRGEATYRASSGLPQRRYKAPVSVSLTRVSEWTFGFQEIPPPAFRASRLRLQRQAVPPAHYPKSQPIESICACMCVCAKSLPSCSTPYDPTDCSPPGFSVHGILQTRILEWTAIPSSRGSSDSGIKLTSLTSPALAGGFFTTSTTR